MNDNHLDNCRIFTGHNCSCWKKRMMKKTKKSKKKKYLK